MSVSDTQISMAFVSCVLVSSDLKGDIDVEDPNMGNDFDDI